MKHEVLLTAKLMVTITLALAISICSTSGVFARSLDDGGTWTTRASMPTARYDMATIAASDGRIYTFGGSLHDGSATSAVEAYDPVADAWTIRRPMPTARWGAGAAGSNGKIYVIGGWAGLGSPMLQTVEAYDPATDTWTTRAPMPTARETMAVVAAINGKIYAIGGNSTCSGCGYAVNEMYDPLTNTWTTRAPMPGGRFYVGAATASGGTKIYVIGGRSLAETAVATVEEYHPITDTWTSRANMPTARELLGAATGSNGKIYAMGGIVLTEAGWVDLSTVEEYDPVTDTWVSSGNMPTARHSLGLATAGNGKIYAIGGAVNQGPTFSTVEEFTPPAPTLRLSGADWVNAFPGSVSLDDLDPSFRSNVRRLIDALQAGGATVNITSTYRPPERAYLMHWSWEIGKDGYPADKVPPMPGVDIEWWHGDTDASQAAAMAMVRDFEIQSLQVAPALGSNHTLGLAIDMEITWKGDLTVVDGNGAKQTIKGGPRSSTNKDLIKVAATFDVIHFTDVQKDKNHWSVNGR